MRKKRRKKRTFRLPPGRGSPLFGNPNKYEVDIQTDCWIWIGATNGSARSPNGKKNRYGVLRDPRPGPNKNKLIPAHHYFWEEHTGQKVPEGMTLDHHICDFGLCVNPEHVRVCEPLENSTLGADKKYGRGKYAPRPVDLSEVPF